MKKKDILNCFICIAITVIFIGVACFGIEKNEVHDKKMHNSMIKRSATGQFTRGGTVSSGVNKNRNVHSRIIYIGEPTEGLLDRHKFE